MSNEEKEKILKGLEEELDGYFNKAELKYIASETLQKKKYIDYIIKHRAKNEKEKKILYDNYFDVFEKVERFYKGYMIEEREKMQIARENAREEAKVKRRDRIGSLLLINKWLDDLNKKL